MVYKCDICKHKNTGSPDGTPALFDEELVEVVGFCEEYCGKGHWFGLGEPDDIVTEDPWADCEDFSPLTEDSL
jgi:hypothetical protein